MPSIHAAVKALTGGAGGHVQARSTIEKRQATARARGGFCGVDESKEAYSVCAVLQTEGKNNTTVEQFFWAMLALFDRDRRGFARNSPVFAYKYKGKVIFVYFHQFFPVPIRSLCVICIFFKSKEQLPSLFFDFYRIFLRVAAAFYRKDRRFLEKIYLKQKI